MAQSLELGDAELGRRPRLRVVFAQCGAPNHGRENGATVLLVSTNEVKGGTGIFFLDGKI